MGAVCRGLAVVTMLGAACRFSGGSGGAGSDASSDAAVDGAIDAGDAGTSVCAELTLNLTVDGAELTDFATDLPYAVGDSIRLNAGASCSPTGNLTFAWDLGGGDFVSRNAALDDFFIEVYPDGAGDLTLQVTIDDGASAPLTQAIPIVGAGFSALDVFDGNDGVISEMLIADGRLWLASDRGAVSQEVAMLDTVPYENVNDTAATVNDSVPSDVSDVSYDSDNNVVSFLPSDGSAAFFYDREADQIDAFTPVDTDVTGTLVDVMPLANGGVRILSTEQVETSNNYVAFTLEWTRDRAVAVTTQGNDVLAGGERLFRMVNATMSDEKEIFGADDPDGIVTFFQDADGALWIGSDLGNADTGIGVIDDFDDATITEHLLGEKVRSIGQDGAGDMWVATETGVFRFKSDWGVWIQLDTGHGLATVDSRALVVDEAGGRNRILVGSATDLFVLDRP